MANANVLPGSNIHLFGAEDHQECPVLMRPLPPLLTMLRGIRNMCILTMIQVTLGMASMASRVARLMVQIGYIFISIDASMRSMTQLLIVDLTVMLSHFVPGWLFSNDTIRIGVLISISKACLLLFVCIFFLGRLSGFYWTDVVAIVHPKVMAALMLQFIVDGVVTHLHGAAVTRTNLSTLLLLNSSLLILGVLLVDLMWWTPSSQTCDAAAEPAGRAGFCDVLLNKSTNSAASEKENIQILYHAKVAYVLQATVMAASSGVQNLLELFPAPTVVGEYVAEPHSPAPPASTAGTILHYPFQLLLFAQYSIKRAWSNNFVTYGVMWFKPYVRGFLGILCNSLFTWQAVRLDTACRSLNIVIWYNIFQNIVGTANAFNQVVLVYLFDLWVKRACSPLSESVVGTLSAAGEVCPICLCEHEPSVSVRLPCGHVLHQECVNTMLRHQQHSGLGQGNPQDQQQQQQHHENQQPPQGNAPNADNNNSNSTSLLQRTCPVCRATILSAPSLLAAVFGVAGLVGADNSAPAGEAEVGSGAGAGAGAGTGGEGSHSNTTTSAGSPGQYSAAVSEAGMAAHAPRSTRGSMSEGSPSTDTIAAHPSIDDRGANGSAVQDKEGDYLDLTVDDVGGSGEDCSNCDSDTQIDGKDTFGPEWLDEYPAQGGGDKEGDDCSAVGNVGVGSGDRDGDSEGDGDGYEAACRFYRETQQPPERLPVPIQSMQRRKSRLNRNMLSSSVTASSGSSAAMGNGGSSVSTEDVSRSRLARGFSVRGEVDRDEGTLQSKGNARPVVHGTMHPDANFAFNEELRRHVSKPLQDHLQRHQGQDHYFTGTGAGYVASCTAPSTSGNVRYCIAGTLPAASPALPAPTVALPTPSAAATIASKAAVTPAAAVLHAPNSPTVPACDDQSVRSVKEPGATIMSQDADADAEAEAEDDAGAAAFVRHKRKFVELVKKQEQKKQKTRGGNSASAVEAPPKRSSLRVASARKR